MFDNFKPIIFATESSNCTANALSTWGFSSQKTLRGFLSWVQLTVISLDYYL